MRLRYLSLLAPTGFSATLFACLVSIPILAPPVIAYPDNPPAGRTGAPTENTCNICHSGPLDDGQGTLELLNAPATYTPGQKYSLTVSLTRSGATRWGFQITSLFTATDGMAGTLEAPSNLTIFQTKGSRMYVAHTNTLGADGTFWGTHNNGPVSWTFDWTAPAAGGGIVKFYVVGVAADGDDFAGPGDLVYLNHNVTSTEGVPTAIAETETTWGWIKSHYR